MDDFATIQQSPPEAATSPPEAQSTGVFPVVAPHRSSSQSWKAALALLLAGGTLTSCGRLVGGGKTPVYSGPFGRHEATHLLRRAAARGNASEADELATKGLKGAVESLLETPDLPTEEDPGYFGKEFTRYTHEWVNHWLNTSTPLAERLTLFWHGHFVTEASKTNFWNTYHKINKLRELSLSTFKDLLYMIAADPAMLIYLDNTLSTKKHPNENWARELMELFTLGEGHYTEEDIQEIARAFTGWRVTIDAGRQYHYFDFSARDHDPDPKTVLGHRVHRRYNPIFEGYDVLNILLGMRQTYLYIGEKLLRFFFHPEPGREMIEKGADVLKGGTVRDFLYWLFTHPDFYSDKVRNALVKSPIEYAVGMLYAAGRREVVDKLFFRIRDLDQDPYNPPDVSGWPLASMEWLSDTMLINRLKFIGIVTNDSSSGTPQAPVDYSVFMDGGVDPLSLIAPEAQLL